MNDNGPQQFSQELNYIYTTLNQDEVEQFYTGYKLWSTQQRLSALQEQIGRLRIEISENAQRIQQVQPPAVALATLVRLQAKGVNDIDLLDRMLERGEEWLDLMMQRLDYCEQLDFIHDNYIQWCENALEGAYDWIDSMRDTNAETMPRPVVTTEINEANVEATEELLLSKLTSEEESSSVENTFKRPAVLVNLTAEETQSESGLLDDVEPRIIAASEEEPATAHEASFSSKAEVEDSSSTTATEQTDVRVTIPEYRNVPIPAQELKVQRRPRLRRRLLAIFWP